MSDNRFIRSHALPVASAMNSNSDALRTGAILGLTCAMSILSGLQNDLNLGTSQRANAVASAVSDIAHRYSPMMSALSEPPVQTFAKINAETGPTAPTPDFPTIKAHFKL